MGAGQGLPLASLNFPLTPFFGPKPMLTLLATMNLSEALRFALALAVAPGIVGLGLSLHSLFTRKGG